MQSNWGLYRGHFLECVDMEAKRKTYLVIFGIVAGVVVAILGFIGIMVGVSLKSLTTQERKFIDHARLRKFIVLPSKPLN